MSPVTVVTGAAGALGSGVARFLVGQGQRVALVGRSTGDERARDLAAELGPGAAFEGFDAASDAAWAIALDRLEASLGPVTGGVLAVGGWRGGRALWESDAYGAMIASNVDTAHAALRALLGRMIVRRAGSVVVVGSRAVARPWESAGAAAYAASKAAVVSLAQVAAAETLGHGVRVNAVLPSTIDTPANRAAMPKADPTTWVSIESLAGVIAFLLSDAARDVSGAAVPVYGKA
jgi:NAD(P)-dependent dehydrogenase (short-subunit alcohol dehydrogenase family)